MTLPTNWASRLASLLTLDGLTGPEFRQGHEPFSSKDTHHDLASARWESNLTSFDASSQNDASIGSPRGSLSSYGTTDSAPVSPRSGDVSNPEESLLARTVIEIAQQHLNSCANEFSPRVACVSMTVGPVNDIVYDAVHALLKKAKEEEEASQKFKTSYHMATEQPLSDDPPSPGSLPINSDNRMSSKFNDSMKPSMSMPRLFSTSALALTSTPGKTDMYSVLPALPSPSTAISSVSPLVTSSVSTPKPSPPLEQSVPPILANQVQGKQENGQGRNSMTDQSLNTPSSTLFGHRKRQDAFLERLRSTHDDKPVTVFPGTLSVIETEVSKPPVEAARAADLDVHRLLMGHRLVGKGRVKGSAYVRGEYRRARERQLAAGDGSANTILLQQHNLANRLTYGHVKDDLSGLGSYMEERGVGTLTSESLSMGLPGPEMLTLRGVVMGTTTDRPNLVPAVTIRPPLPLKGSRGVLAIAGASLTSFSSSPHIKEPQTARLPGSLSFTSPTDAYPSGSQTDRNHRLSHSGSSCSSQSGQFTKEPLGSCASHDLQSIHSLLTAPAHHNPTLHEGLETIQRDPEARGPADGAIRAGIGVVVESLKPKGRNIYLNRAPHIQQQTSSTKGRNDRNETSVDDGGLIEIIGADGNISTYSTPHQLEQRIEGDNEGEGGGAGDTGSEVERGNPHTLGLGAINNPMEAAVRVKQAQDTASNERDGMIRQVTKKSIGMLGGVMTGKSTMYPPEATREAQTSELVKSLKRVTQMAVAEAGSGSASSLIASMHEGLEELSHGVGFEDEVGSNNPFDPLRTMGEDITASSGGGGGGMSTSKRATAWRRGQTVFGERVRQRKLQSHHQSTSRQTSITTHQKAQGKGVLSSPSSNQPSAHHAPAKGPSLAPHSTLTSFATTHSSSFSQPRIGPGGILNHSSNPLVAAGQSSLSHNYPLSSNINSDRQPLFTSPRPLQSIASTEHALLIRDLTLRAQATLSIQALAAGRATELSFLQGTHAHQDVPSTQSPTSTAPFDQSRSSPLNRGSFVRPPLTKTAAGFLDRYTDPLAMTTTSLPASNPTAHMHVPTLPAPTSLTSGTESSQEGKETDYQQPPIGTQTLSAQLDSQPLPLQVIRLKGGATKLTPKHITTVFKDLHVYLPTSADISMTHSDPRGTRTTTAPTTTASAIEAPSSSSSSSSSPSLGQHNRVNMDQPVEYRAVLTRIVYDKDSADIFAEYSVVSTPVSSTTSPLSSPAALPQDNPSSSQAEDGSTPSLSLQSASGPPGYIIPIPRAAAASIQLEVAKRLGRFFSAESAALMRKMKAKIEGSPPSSQRDSPPRSRMEGLKDALGDAIGAQSGQNNMDSTKAGPIAMDISAIVRYNPLSDQVLYGSDRGRERGVGSLARGVVNVAGRSTTIPNVKYLGNDKLAGVSLSPNHDINTHDTARLTTATNHASHPQALSQPRSLSFRAGPSGKYQIVQPGASVGTSDPVGSSLPLPNHHDKLVNLSKAGQHISIDVSRPLPSSSVSHHRRHPPEILGDEMNAGGRRRLDDDSNTYESDLSSAHAALKQVTTATLPRQQPGHRLLNQQHPGKAKDDVSGSITGTTVPAGAIGKNIEGVGVVQSMPRDNRSVREQNITTTNALWQKFRDRQAPNNQHPSSEDGLGRVSDDQTSVARGEDVSSHTDDAKLKRNSSVRNLLRTKDSSGSAGGTSDIPSSDNGGNRPLLSVGKLRIPEGHVLREVVEPSNIYPAPALPSPLDM